MKNKLLLIGGGGHCHSVIDSVLSAGLYTKIGVVAKNQDNYNELMEDILIAPFLVGIDADIPELLANGWNSAFVTLGSVGITSGRRALYKNISELGFEIPTIIDPSAEISSNVSVNKGAFIGKRAVINAGSKIGICAIINTGAIIEHDCVIGDFAHISPGTTLCGQVAIGNDSHIGAGSVVRQMMEIGSNSIVGAGSVVVKNIPDNVKAFGNPCRVVE